VLLKDRRDPIGKLLRVSVLFVRHTHAAGTPAFTLTRFSSSEICFASSSFCASSGIIESTLPDIQLTTCSCGGVSAGHGSKEIIAYTSCDELYREGTETVIHRASIV
jgi:hypothetical protein